MMVPRNPASARCLLSPAWPSGRHASLVDSRRFLFLARSPGAAWAAGRLQGTFRTRAFSSSGPLNVAERVHLAYDLHTPPRPLTDKHTRPILFLHGLFGSKKNNRGMSKALARDLGRYIYALDLRNHGESPHLPRHDYLAMAQDVADFIEDHGLKDVTIIGHSMGAKTAMTLALRSPDLVRGIVSVDNAPIDAAISSDFGRYVRGMKEIDAAHVTRQADADKILQSYEPSLTIRQFLLGNLHRVSLPSDDGRHEGSSSSSSSSSSSHPHVLQFRVPLDVLGRSLGYLGDFPFKDPQAVRYEKPALFVRGTKSTYVPDETIPLIGQFFPRFELVDVEAGHWLISENPEAFRQAVVRFLSPKD